MFAGGRWRRAAELGPARFCPAEETVWGVELEGHGWTFRTSRMICAIWLIGQCKELLGPLLFPQTQRALTHKPAK